MGIREQRRQSKILAEQEAIDQTATRLYSELQSLVSRVNNYAALMYQGNLDATGEFDAAELTRQEATFTSFENGINNINSAFTEVNAIKGVDDAETTTNLNTFVTNNSLDVAAYSAQFD